MTTTNLTDYAGRPTQRPERIMQATLDALTSHVAVLDESGVVVSVNTAWWRSAWEQEMPLSRCAIGSNYLSVCDAAAARGMIAAASLASGLRALIRGPQDELLIEFPSHNSGSCRWLRVLASRLRDHQQGHILLCIDDVTSQSRAATLHRHQFSEAAAEAKTNDLTQTTAFHDLKNSLAVFDIHLQLLQRRVMALGTADAHELVDIAADLRSTRQEMVTQVEDLLDLARLTAGDQPQLRFYNVDLVGLVQHALNKYQRFGSHRIEFAPPTSSVSGHWDGRRIERMMGNLMSNALKYSPQGSTVSVGIEPTVGAGAVAIRIRDEGIGIALEDLPSIFEPFRRAMNAAGQVEGTGIGLASVRLSAAQHGGCVEILSALGKGSRVSVYLPARAIVPREQDTTIVPIQRARNRGLMAA